MKIIIGGFMVILGIFVFVPVGIAELFSNRLFDGTVNAVIGSFLVWTGLKNMGDNL